jgi:hypothetical protein
MHVLLILAVTAREEKAQLTKIQSEDVKIEKAGELSRA